MIEPYHVLDRTINEDLDNYKNKQATTHFYENIQVSLDTEGATVQKELSVHTISDPDAARFEFKLQNQEERILVENETFDISINQVKSDSVVIDVTSADGSTVTDTLECSFLVLETLE